jgi:hypothetical protein
VPNLLCDAETFRIVSQINDLHVADSFAPERLKKRGAIELARPNLRAAVAAVSWDFAANAFAAAMRSSDSRSANWSLRGN